MNVKETLITTALDNVVKGCSVESYSNIKSITKEDILGKSRAQLVVIARCILVKVLVKLGFPLITIAELLHKSKNTVRNLLTIGDQYMKTSNVFKLVYEDVLNSCENINTK